MEPQELEGRFGPYRLLKRIARGGMGEVFLAKQNLARGYERTLVVKRILPHLSDDEKFVKMFLREAHTASRFHHKNIVRIFQVGQEQSQYYLAMEYVEGKDLRAYLTRAFDRNVDIPVEISCAIILEVCEGLSYAHTKTGPGGRSLNLVHRDVSPQNILISYEGNVRLIDFGISKAADGRSATHPGGVEGKVPYLSPEQARGDPLDQRSDIFSTGVLFFELLSGRRFFAGSSEVQILEAIRNFSVDRALEPWRLRLPTPLVGILQKALHERPSGRYETMEQMGREIDQYLVGNGFRNTPLALSQLMNRLFEEELALEEDSLTRTRTLASPSPLSEEVPAGEENNGVGMSAPGVPSPVRKDNRILRHKLVILVLLLIILLEAIVFIVREHHWRREGLYKYRNVRQTVQPFVEGRP